MNLLFMSADDMSFGSTGFSGCEFDAITPELDELARQGVSFSNGHTTVGLCQPSRSVWMTGLYPWNNGATGFNDVKTEVSTLVDIFNKKGFSTGIIGKAEHLGPSKKFRWNYQINGYSDFCGRGKSAEQYYKFVKFFLNEAKSPFFLMVNSHFPHRPFEERSRFHPSKVRVPGFLPDTSEVRGELALYYEGVAKCDHMVGLVVKALKESGKYDDTIIVFTSDHGMSFPFVKACCYHFSTKVPLVWHCPKLFKPRSVDCFVSGIDIFPTLLDLLGLPKTKTDGASYRQALENGTCLSEEVYTCLCQLYSGRYFQTRAIHNEEYCYVLNFWSDGSTEFVEDGSLDHQASVQSIKKFNPGMYKKLRHRSFEELYDIRKDYYATTNIAGEDSEAKTKMRNVMFRHALKSNDGTVLDHQMFKRRAKIL